jgi:hypothetical protein
MSYTLRYVSFTEVDSVSGCVVRTDVPVYMCEEGGGGRCDWYCVRGGRGGWGHIRGITVFRTDVSRYTDRCVTYSDNRYV